MFGVLKMGFVILLLLSACSAEPPANGTKYDAKVVCESAVKGQLKAPSTARLTVDSNTELEGGRYRIVGHFDAENSFGAMLRGTYTCTVRHTTGYLYDFEDFKINP
jgi:hypothetical protein